MTYSVSVIVGRKAILKVLPELEQAASAWEQPALVRELPFYLAAPGKLPVLLLLSSGERQSMDLQGAVFLYAFGHGIFGRRLLSNTDRFGRIGVFGPVDRRPSLAFAAAKHLLETGSVVVRLSFTNGNWSPPERTTPSFSPFFETLQAERTKEEWELLTRELFVDLTLHPDSNDTLSHLGRRTRRNIRDAMRKCFCEPRLQLRGESGHFSGRIPSAQSSFRVSCSFARSSVALPTVHSSTRLAGGPISAETVILEWQTNDLVYAKYSRSLLMRGYLMEYFGQQGMRSLFSEGGTAHCMTKHFNKRTVHLLRVRRPVL